MAENNRADIWRNLLKRWPEGMPKKGVVMTELNESIPFVGYVYDDDLMVVQRQTPDAIGARQVIVPFSSISYMKITAIVLPKAYADFGFQGTLPKV